MRKYKAHPESLPARLGPFSLCGCKCTSKIYHLHQAAEFHCCAPHVFVWRQLKMVATINNPPKQEIMQFYKCKKLYAHLSWQTNNRAFGDWTCPNSWIFPKFLPCLSGAFSWSKFLTKANKLNHKCNLATHACAPTWAHIQ